MRTARLCRVGRRLLGHVLPLRREIYLEEDPPRMFKMIRQTRRTCLAFKILAAGGISTACPVENRLLTARSGPPYWPSCRPRTLLLSC